MLKYIRKIFYKENIIMDFNETFDGAETIVLDTNYRSSQKILECANKLIKNNKEVSYAKFSRQSKNSTF